MRRFIRSSVDNSKIVKEIHNYMNQNLDPYHAGSYRDAVDFCKELKKDPQNYIDDNYENLINKKVINKNNNKKEIINIIINTLKQLGKDWLADIKMNRDQFEEQEDW